MKKTKATKQIVCFNGWGNVSLSINTVIIKDVFTNGKCGCLALAIHRLTKLPMVYTIQHAGILTPTNMIIDILGAHTVKDFEKKWDKIEDVCFAPARIRKCGFEFSEMDKIKPFAELVIAKYKKHIGCI